MLFCFVLFFNLFVNGTGKSCLVSGKVRLSRFEMRCDVMHSLTFGMITFLKCVLHIRLKLDHEMVPTFACSHSKTYISKMSLLVSHEGKQRRSSFGILSADSSMWPYIIIKYLWNIECVSCNKLATLLQHSMTILCAVYSVIKFLLFYMKIEPYTPRNHVIALRIFGDNHVTPSLALLPHLRPSSYSFKRP